MLQEDPHLREQGFRVEGLDDVVDRPVGVALDDLLFFTVDGGHENNRRVTRSRTFPDQSGGREAVKIGHLHVEQDQRALVVQQEPERLPPRRGSDQALPQRFEDRLEGDEVRGTIVDDQDGGRRVVHRSTLQPWPLKCANLSDQTSAHARLFQGPPIERVFGPTFECCMPLASTRSTLPRRWREAQSSENDDGRCRRQITSAPAAA